MGSNPAGGTNVYKLEKIINEKKFKTLEKERPNEMEMAKKTYEERKTNTKKQINRYVYKREFFLHITLY